MNLHVRSFDTFIETAYSISSNRLFSLKPHQHHSKCIHLLHLISDDIFPTGLIIIVVSLYNSNCIKEKNKYSNEFVKFI